VLLRLSARVYGAKVVGKHIACGESDSVIVGKPGRGISGLGVRGEW